MRCHAEKDTHVIYSAIILIPESIKSNRGADDECEPHLNVKFILLPFILHFSISKQLFETLNNVLKLFSLVSKMGLSNHNCYRIYKFKSMSVLSYAIAMSMVCQDHLICHRWTSFFFWDYLNDVDKPAKGRGNSTDL